MIKRCLKESERAFSIPSGHLDRLIREPPRAEKKLGSARGGGGELKREAKSKMSCGGKG